MDKTQRMPLIFSYLSPEELDRLYELAVLRSFKKGEAIIRQGHLGKGIYVIEKGKVAVTTRTLAHDDVLLTELGEGSFFGETSLFAQVASASVKAITNTTVFFLSNRVIQSLRILDPLLGYKIIRAITEITANRIRQKLNDVRKILKKIHHNKARQFCAPIVLSAKPPKPYAVKKGLKADDPLLSVIFKDFTHEEIEILLSYMTLVEAEPKSILFQTEETEVSCYFTLSGVVQRVVESGRLTSKLNICAPGDLLGHVDFCVQKERMVTGVLREHSQFLRMDAHQKNELEENHPILWSRLHYNISAEVVKMLFLTNQLLLRLMSECKNV